MSAREKILRYVEENQSFLDLPCDPETGHFVDDAEAHVNGLLNAYAHELAEKQRAARADIMEAWGGSLHQDSLTELIDLIDPEVSGDV